MPRLGVLLVRAGALTEESVNRALSIQGFAGGRIGTLLLERGSVSEDDVGKALAEQHGCDYVPWRVLGAVPPNIVAALPAKFAIRHSAVPVEIGEGFVRIVLRDPANLRILDELFFVTGKKIVPAVAPEVRIYQALEKCYGERRTPRFAILAEKLSRPTLSSVIKKPLPPPPDFSATPPSLPGDPLPLIVANADGDPLATDWTIPDAPPVGWGGFSPTTEPPAIEGEPESIAWEEIPSQPGRPASAPEEPRARPMPAAAARERSTHWRQTAGPASEPGPAAAPAEGRDALACRLRSDPRRSQSRRDLRSGPANAGAEVPHAAPCSPSRAKGSSAGPARESALQPMRFASSTSPGRSRRSS